MRQTLSRPNDASLNKPRRRRLDPAARRAELLEGALAVFARRGIGRATHAEVAEEAGCSLATSFVYFPTREDLVAAVLEEVERFYAKMIAAEKARALPGPSAIRHYVEAFTDSVSTHPDYARVWLEWSTAIREEIWPRYLAFQDRIVEALAATIERAKAGDSVAADVDGKDVARLMVGAAHMLAQMKFSGEPDEKISRFVETLMTGVLGIR